MPRKKSFRRFDGSTTRANSIASARVDDEALDGSDTQDDVVSVSELSFIGGPRSDKYAVEERKARALRPGEAVLLSPPKGLDVSTYTARLATLTTKLNENPPDGHVYRKRVTKDRRYVALMLVEGSPRRRRHRG